MGIMVRVLQVVFLVSHLTLLITVYSDVDCQNFKFVIDEDVVYNHILEGHVFRRLTVNSAAQCHVTCKDDCLCASINYFPVSQENNCELNDVDKAMESAAMKWNPEVNYYDLVRSYTVKGGGKYIPGKHRCINRCCNPNPCVNGGVCQEICDPYSMRFTCACPDTYTGQRCEKIKYPRNCQDIAKNGAPGSGMYPIFNSTNEAFSVYCDMKSEPGFVWALIQSFSFANREMFATERFGDDFPVNNSNSDVDWNAYRLSLSQMVSIRVSDTQYLRATCNYPTEGLQYTDYARAKLADSDIFGSWGRSCRLYEYINIRGNNCSNCTALTRQKDGAWLINSVKSSTFCEFNGTTGAQSDSERNFGNYRDADGPGNTNHRCSASPDSTTQHWFGAKFNF